MNYISHQEVAYFGLSQVICLGIGIFYKPMIIYSFIDESVKPRHL